MGRMQEFDIYKETSVVSLRNFTDLNNYESRKRISIMDNNITCVKKRSKTKVQSFPEKYFVSFMQNFEFIFNMSFILILQIGI